MGRNILFRNAERQDRPCVFFQSPAWAAVRMASTQSGPVSATPCASITKAAARTTRSRAPWWVSENNKKKITWMVLSNGALWPNAILVPPSSSSRRQLRLSRGRLRWRAAGQHLFVTVTQRQPSAEANTRADHWLWPQTVPACGLHTGHGQTPSSAEPHLGVNICCADWSTCRWLDDPSSWSLHKSWSHHHGCRNDGHNWSPRPGRWGLQREAFWCLHANKKRLHICLQRWVIPFSWRRSSGSTCVTFFSLPGKYFFELDHKSVLPGYPKLIKDVWGIDGSVDTAFTRYNCQGKTYIFKVGKEQSGPC